uniref:DEK-C domain-containing protein n=1 Tax=Auxenochlorella protothecoides TaxID=3075 RepID=A0A1D2A640_AUXPR
MRKEAIRTALFEYLEGADLEAATQRTVQQELEDRLGEPLNEYKEYIRAQTDAFLAGCTARGNDEVDDEDFQQPRKRVKGAGAEQHGKNDAANGHPLSGDVYAAVRDWHGRVGVDIRQYYTDKEGQLKPGFKGLALSPQGWGLLSQALPNLCKRLDARTSGDAVELDKNQRASVSEFKGTWALDLRQWHAGSDAGLIPGKKGVRLGREQASALLAAAPLLDSKLNRKGAAGPSVVDHPTPASNAKPTAQHPGPSLTHAKPSPAPITVQPGPVSEAADRPPDAGPVELGSNKRAEVTTFKGRSLLSLREYYEKDGQLLPGKRGIALAADQVLALLTAAPQLTAGLERRDDSCRAQLSASRRAGVSAFKGRHSIDIREWYEVSQAVMSGGRHL